MSEKKKQIKKIDALIEAFKAERLKWVVGLSVARAKASEKEKFEGIVEGITKDEIERQMLLTELKARGACTISDLSKETDMNNSRILQHLIALRRTGAIAEVGEKEDEYLYKAT